MANKLSFRENLCTSKSAHSHLSEHSQRPPVRWLRRAGRSLELEKRRDAVDGIPRR